MDGSSPPPFLSFLIGDNVGNTTPIRSICALGYGRGSWYPGHPEPRRTPMGLLWAPGTPIGAGFWTENPMSAYQTSLSAGLDRAKTPTRTPTPRWGAPNPEAPRRGLFFASGYPDRTPVCACTSAAPPKTRDCAWGGKGTRPPCARLQRRRPQCVCNERCRPPAPRPTRPPPRVSMAR